MLYCFCGTQTDIKFFILFLLTGITSSQSLTSIAGSDDSVDDPIWNSLVNAVCNLDAAKADDIISNDITNTCSKCLGFKKRYTI